MLFQDWCTKQYEIINKQNKANVSCVLTALFVEHHQLTATPL